MKKSQPDHRTSSLLEDKDKQNQSFKQLKELYLSDQRKRFPSVPEHGRCIPTYSDKTTNGLTKCIIDYIRLRGFFIERTGNEGRIIDNNRVTYTDVIGRTRTIGNIRRIKSSGSLGTSDLKAVIAGRFVAIEIKCRFTNDRIRPDQLKYKHLVEQAGGIYYIAQDFTSFFNWFNETFGGY